MPATDYVVLGLFVTTGVAAVMYLREKNKQPPLIPPSDIENKVEATNTTVANAPTETGATKPLEEKIKDTQSQAEEVSGKIEEHKTNIQTIEKEPPSQPLSGVEGAKDYFDNVLGGKK